MFVDTLTLKFKGTKGEVNSGILKASTAQLMNNSQKYLSDPWKCNGLLKKPHWSKKTGKRGVEVETNGGHPCLIIQAKDKPLVKPTSESCSIWAPYCCLVSIMNHAQYVIYSLPVFNLSSDT